MTTIRAFSAMKRKNNLSFRHNGIWRVIRVYVLTVILCGGLLATAQAQSGYQTEHTKNTPDQTLRSNARVNPSTLAMELSIPLAGFPGRNGMGMPLTLNYSSKLWRLDLLGYGSAQTIEFTTNLPKYAEKSAAGWTSSFGAAQIEIPAELYDCHGNPVGDAQNHLPPPGPGSCTGQSLHYTTRVRVKLPDGQAVELRKDDGIYLETGSIDWTGTYLSTDSSKMRLEMGSTSSTLYLPDGSRYYFQIPSGGTEQIGYRYEDRNGNRLEFNQATRTWTDTLGRSLTSPLPLNLAAQEQTVGTQILNLPGLTGSSARQYQLVWKNLGDTGVLLDPNETLRYEGTRQCPYGAGSPTDALFLDSSQMRVCRLNIFNPVVLTEIALPGNGGTTLKYKFWYNRYGEITKVEYPTGATERFEYGQMPFLSKQWDYYREQFNRGVVNRYVKESGTAEERHWSYEATRNTGSNLYKIKTTAPDRLTVTEQYLGMSWERVTGQTQPKYGYDNPLQGRPLEERFYHGTTLKSRKLLEYEYTGVVGSGVYLAKRDPRLKREVSIVFEPGSTNALATMTVNDYDTAGSADLKMFSSLNLKTMDEYVFIVVPASLAATETVSQLTTRFSSANLYRRTETDYLYDANYTNQTSGFAGLVKEVRVKDPANGYTIVSHSKVEYDTPGYQHLSYGTSGTPNWQDLQTVYRGNPTKTKTWDSSANNGAGNWIVAYAQFDQFGNLRKAWTPVYEGATSNNFTETQYDDAFSDQINRNTYAYATKTISVVPDSTNTHGSNQPFESTATFDFNTGLPISTTDANGTKSRMEYIDALLRPTAAEQLDAGGANILGRTETVYTDTSGAVSVKVKTKIDVDKWTEAIQYVDGFGRSWKTEKADSAGNVFALTEYEEMGRVKRVTNPYRSGETPVWTVNTYDDFGRVWKVKTPDNAEVITTYGLATTGSHIGTVVTVKDQALKERRSITNALGQLTRVDEPNSAGQLGAVNTPNQPTVYTYDALSNLKTVTQTGNNTEQCGGTTATCTQTRTFNYNSLSRLLSAQNPEGGTILYSYDASGNLLTKQDARNITTTYVYDALNRVKTRNYNDSTTPAVTYFYDGKYLNPQGTTVLQASGAIKGKLTSVRSTVSATNYTAFDSLGRITASQQVSTPEQFAGSQQPYNFAYSYNLGGALTSQTYPSGRMVRNVFEAEGELSAVSSRSVATAPLKPYASNFTYTAHGAVAAMQLGNNRWETTLFNERLQPTQLGLGTTSSTTNSDLWKVTFNYGGAQNNGNVVSQTITVPSVTVGSTTYNGFIATQNYVYDSLNRLQSAVETINSTETWRQTYTFDRFGNRRFNLAQTTTPATPADGAPKVINPEIDPNTNRLKEYQDADGVKDYEFDAAGNMIRDTSGRTFLYDGENKQKEVKDVSSQSIGTYFYDGDGKRVKKVVGAETTIFVYDASGKLAAEYSTATPPAPAQAKTSYLTSDHLGSPRVLTDQTGTVISRRDFLPFGEEIGVTAPTTAGRSTHPQYSSDTTIQKFATYERDDEADLDFAQARYYNYRHGRFTSIDPLMASADIINPQTFNRYVYVGNNPVNINDPTGEIWGVINGSATWYKDKDAMLAAGAVAATQFVGWIGNQMYALNPNANVAQPVANAGQAIQQLVTWGAGAGAISGTLSGAFGVGAVAAAAIAATIVCGAPCTNRYQATAGYPGSGSARDYAMLQRSLLGDAAPKTIFDYVDSQGNLLPQYLNENTSESGSGSASEQAAEGSTNTEANKPNTSANKSDNSDNYVKESKRPTNKGDGPANNEDSTRQGHQTNKRNRQKHTDPRAGRRKTKDRLKWDRVYRPRKK